MTRFMRAVHFARNGLPVEYEPTSRKEEEFLLWATWMHRLYDGDAAVLDELSRRSWATTDLPADLLWEKRATLYGDAEGALARFHARRVLERASKNPGPERLWEIEALAAHAFLLHLADRIDEAAPAYERLLEICAGEGEHQKRSSALTNLGGFELFFGSTQRLRGFIGATESLLEQTGLAIYGVTAIELKGHLAFLSQDAAKRAEFVAEVERASFPFVQGWQAAPLASACLSAIRCGDLDEARVIREKARAHVSSNELQAIPNVLRECNLALSDRLHEPAPADFDSPRRPFGRQAVYQAIAECNRAIRARGRAPEAEAKLAAWLGRFPFHPSVRMDCEIALARSQLADGALEVSAWRSWASASDRARENGRSVDAAKARFLAVEILAARNDARTCQEQLRALLRLCEEERMTFDGEVAMGLLNASSGTASPAAVASSLDAARALRALLDSWPWNQVARAGSPAVATSSSPPPPRAFWREDAPLSKAELFLKLIRGGRGRFVSHDHVCREIWGEPFDPVAHLGRIYQLARAAREKLIQRGEDPSALVASYGEGYAFRSGAHPTPKKDPRAELLGALERRASLDSAEAAQVLGASQRHALRLLSGLEAEGVLTSEVRFGKRRFALAKKRTG